jgi:hypothetical protein
MTWTSRDDSRQARFHDEVRLATKQSSHAAYTISWTGNQLTSPSQGRSLFPSRDISFDMNMFSHWHPFIYFSIFLRQYKSMSSERTRQLVVSWIAGHRQHQLRQPGNGPWLSRWTMTARRSKRADISAGKPPCPHLLRVHTHVCATYQSQSH